MPYELQIDIFYKILMNTVLVSIPEGLFCVLFTYIMMGEFDQWKDEECSSLFQSWDYPRVFIPVVISALISDILRYTGVAPGIITLGTSLSLFFGIVAMGDVFNNARALKWVSSAFIYLLISVLFAGLCESSYLPIVLYNTGLTIVEINNNILLNFLLSLPSRVMEYPLLAFIIAHKRSLLKEHIFKIILNSRALTVLTLLILIVDFCYLIFMANVIWYERILEALPLILQNVVILSIVIFPILNFSVLLWCIYYIHNREAVNKKKVSDKLRRIVEEIETYPGRGNIDNLIWAVNGLTIDLNGIADELYMERTDKKKRG